MVFYPPEMSRQTELDSRLVLWSVQIDQGNHDRAQDTLDRIHLLQWEIGRGLK